MRLSIEVTEQQHQRLKTMAALRRQSIKDYVLSHVLPDINSEAEALLQLEELLATRMKTAHDVVGKSVMQIFEQTHQEMR